MALQENIEQPPAVTAHDAVDHLVEVAKRKSGHFRLRLGFVQGREAGKPTPGPLASLIRAHDRRGLLLYLLMVTKASAPPYDVALPSAAWSRMLGIDPPDSRSARTAISRAWRRLSDAGLISRDRRGREAEVTMLREDGLGEEYTSPGGPGDPYFRVPVSLWTEGPTVDRRWYEELSLPELAVLLIGRSLGDDFLLPQDRAGDWYGLGRDTVAEGLAGLAARDLLDVREIYKKAPLSKTGTTVERRYTLNPPFGPVGRKSGAPAPKKKGTAKKGAAKKGAAKKATAKKGAAKKATAKKGAAKKTTAKRSAATKATAKKGAATKRRA